MEEILSLERCLIELWPQRKTRMLLIKGGMYRIVRKSEVGFPIFDSKLLTWFRESLSCGERWGLGVDDDGGLVFLFPPGFERVDYEGQVSHIPAPRKGMFPKLVIDGLEYSSYLDLLALFGLEDNWFNRCKVNEWAYRMARESPVARETPIPQKELHLKFNRSKLIDTKMSSNGYSKPVVSFQYKGLPTLKGASALIRTFEISPDDLIWCYEQAGAELPSTAKKYIREMRKGTKNLKKSSRPSTEQNTPIEDIISTFRLHMVNGKVCSEGGGEETLKFSTVKKLRDFLINVEDQNISMEKVKAIWDSLK